MVADIIPFYDNGEYHAFYLKGFNDGAGWAKNQTPWGHLTSRNLIQWEVLPDAIVPGVQTEPDGGACYTGSAIRKGELVHLFYTGFSPGHVNGREQLMHAYSVDGIHFTKNTSNPMLLLNQDYYGSGEDFRDPFVFYNEEEQLYWMLFTAGDRQPLNGIRRGVIGLAKSEDLMHWKFHPPIYAPRKYPSLECPDLFRIGDWWYLIFSQFGRTEYRMSHNPYGPWICPKDPYFDAGFLFFYAAKTLFDGKRRFLLGGCGDLQGNRDAQQSMWGGTFVTPREVRQLDNGELALVCPAEFLDEWAYKPAMEAAAFETICGEWSAEGTAVENIDETGFSSVLLSDSLDAFHCKAAFIPRSSNGQIGFILRSSDNHDRCYQVTIDLGNERLAVERFVTMDSFVGPLTEGYRLLGERHIPLAGSESIEVIVMVEQNIIEIFACGVTMTVPIADIETGRFGLFACDAKVRVNNLVFSPTASHYFPLTIDN